MSNQVEYYKDDVGEHRWRVVAENGNVLADSGEGYKNLADCKAGFKSVVTDSYSELAYEDEEEAND